MGQESGHQLGISKLMQLVAMIKYAFGGHTKNV